MQYENTKGNKSDLKRGLQYSFPCNQFNNNDVEGYFTISCKPHVFVQRVCIKGQNTALLVRLNPKTIAHKQKIVHYNRI